ncbi:Deoxynucleoside triphosphate triphosphohydrolase SAMHD1 [Hondaea fermentalgiana]|uniref:Deoxynucleoside triphosphate triphosphohydrolase SAMHD1 n=1 Tax=Hondaea fermentalgiana TaxID=2315210 RepID=A0A2R5GKB0_9STRA|nr:Deoxynucleoside triphosphate triphosphohydrolase SAMHD1 [Hondaea fermentalgiana]|eukprot:GBG28304.1 Deoxynucleoside triphosphate triphosphohydrolase SAMHD1 [Hondaea fermentalgiana]
MADVDMDLTTHGGSDGTSEADMMESPTASRVAQRRAEMHGRQGPQQQRKRLKLDGVGHSAHEWEDDASFELERPIHAFEKIVTDPIHSSMEFPPLLLAVMDTPEYQRLKSLKQLGAAQYVYPGATHSRFEHSLGVAHLGMYFVKMLRSKQPDLGITENDVTCVGLAGLCHDLGHGPFSHLFDGEFLRGKDWSHEMGSVRMLHLLLQRNRIDPEVQYGLSQTDLKFVEELILGKEIEGGVKNRRGRDSSKSFLYDIINNERSGFDVDKLDYILRDSYYTGVRISTGTTVERLGQNARVLPDEKGELTISFPEKSVHAMFGVFNARMWLHRVVYQHKVVKACEFMIRDILRAADPYLTFLSRDGKELRMSESIEDMTVFAQLNDSVLYLIEQSRDPRMRPAQKLLWRLKSRDLYRCCGSADLSSRLSDKSKTSKEETITRQLLAISEDTGLGLDKDDFIVECTLVHHGKGNSNPVDGLRFYSKRNLLAYGQTPRAHASGTPWSPGASQDSQHSQRSQDSMGSTTEGARGFKIAAQKYGGGLLPQRMGANGVRVFCKTSKVEKREAVTRCFRRWTRRELSASPLCHNSQTDPEDEAATRAAPAPVTQPPRTWSQASATSGPPRTSGAGGGRLHVSNSNHSGSSAFGMAMGRDSGLGGGQGGANSQASFFAAVTNSQHSHHSQASRPAGGGSRVNKGRLNFLADDDLGDGDDDDDETL